MNILAIETSSFTGGIAIAQNKKIIGEYLLSVETRYAESLMANIDRLLKECRLDVDDIDAFAVSVGPGSFTGLRIGVSTAKGLAYGTQKPFIAVPTLDALAANLIPSPHRICPILDARQKQIYTALYSPDGERLTDHNVVSPKEWLDELSDANQKIIFLGTGVAAYKKLIQQKLGDNAVWTPFHRDHVFASSVAYLSVQKYKNKDFSDYMELEPMYLRGASAKKKRAMFNI
jgi:tRNA threonylcarbamoyladenosine biosynthesis protein TsaB